MKLNPWRKFLIWLCDLAVRRALRELEDCEYHLAKLALVKRRYLLRWGVDGEPLWDSREDEPTS